MRKPVVIAGVLAVAGLIALNASAFTSTGVTLTAPSSQFIGGTVSQSVSGATLSGISYTFTNPPANTSIATVVLTFADAASDGKTPTVAFTGGTGGATTCVVIAAMTSTCTVATGWANATSVAITVPSV